VSDRDNKVNPRYFMACKTCTAAEWIDADLIEAYINKHTGHQFYLLGAEEFENPEHFTKWFMNFMGWGEKEEK